MGYTIYWVNGMSTIFLGLKIKIIFLIKYEDLIQNPENELEKIINFLKKYLDVKTNDKKTKKF